MKNFSIEAEQHLLACAMIDDQCSAALLEIPEDWFCMNESRLIYRSIQELVRESLSCDSFAVGQHLTQSGKIELAGGMEYLVGLTESMPSLRQFASFKNTLFSYYKIRQLETIKNSIEQQLCSNARPEDVVSYLSGAVVELMTDHHDGGPRDVKEFANEALDFIEWKTANDGAIIGLESGYKKLDYEIDGFQKGQLISIGGRPAMGKSMFAMSIAKELSKQKPVVVFSLEMTGNMLAQRLISSESGVCTSKFKKGNLTEDDFQQLATGIIRIKTDPKLFIDETPGLTTAQIRSRLKAQQVRHGEIGAILIDHIGLIRLMKTQRDGNDIVHDLQIMAKEFDCPLIFLTQLNRSCETRPDKRPVMSDIRELGAIEEDCRVVMFVYRDEYYNENSKYVGITEVSIKKNTMGETGTLYFSHSLGTGKYTEIMPPEIEEDQTRRSKF